MLRHDDPVDQGRQHTIRPHRSVRRDLASGVCTVGSRHRHWRCCLCFRRVLHVSTFLPPIPRPGLCCPGFSRSVWTGPQRYVVSKTRLRHDAGSDSCPARTHPAGLSASFALPSEHPAPNHVVAQHAFGMTCVSPSLSQSSQRVESAPKVQASPCPGRLATSRRRMGSSSYRLLVRLRLLSTPRPRRARLRHDATTQSPSATSVMTSHGMDLHLLTKQHHGRT